MESSFSEAMIKKSSLIRLGQCGILLEPVAELDLELSEQSNRPNIIALLLLLRISNRGCRILIARAVQQHEAGEGKTGEVVRRPGDLLVRRMAEVESADDRLHFDLGHETRKGLDCVGNSGVTATGHQNAVVRQKRLLLLNIVVFRFLGFPIRCLCR